MKALPGAKRRLARSSLAAVLAAAAALAGCAAVGPDFARPHASAAAGYAGRGDRAPAGPRIVSADPPAGAWWLNFGAPELDATMRQALADSPGLDEADATLAQAREALNAARGGLLPHADLNAGLQRERFNPAAFGFSGFPSPTVNLYSVGGAVSYDLDLFGGQKRTVEAASARAEAQARRADAAYLTITGNVGLEAVQIAAVRAQIAAAQSVVEDDRRTLALLRKAVQLGGAAPASGIGAEAQLAADLAVLPALEQELARHRHALSLLVGKSPAEFSAPDFDLARLSLPGEIPVSVPSSLIRRRPDILAVEADLHAATAQIGVETARLYPDIRLTAGLTQTALQPQNIFKYSSSAWNFGSGLSAPLFHGGTLKANRGAAAAAAEAASARYQQTVLRAFVEVSDALAALANDQDAIAAQKRALSVAEADLKDSRTALNLGGGTLLLVLDSQRRVDVARRGLAQATAQRLADAVRLYVATAADWRVAGTRAADRP